MLLQAIARGDADGQTSVAVLEELWHLELSVKAPNLTGLTQRALETFSPVLTITEEMFKLALALDAPRALGANDRLHVATSQGQGIDTLVSADAAFSRVAGIRWVDPLDVVAMRRLLA